jgi:hypothetical protein
VSGARSAPRRVIVPASQAERGSAKQTAGLMRSRPVGLWSHLHGMLATGRGSSGKLCHWLPTGRGCAEVRIAFDDLAVVRGVSIHDRDALRGLLLALVLVCRRKGDLGPVRRPRRLDAVCVVPVRKPTQAVSSDAQEKSALTRDFAANAGYPAADARRSRVPSRREAS